MAASRKPKSNESAPCDLAVHVRGVVQRYAARDARIVVGLSGGVDSVVLLDVLQHLAGPLRITLAAIHVNHGLSPNATRWTAFCRELCRRRAIPLRVRKVAVTRGNSTEAAARTARYAAFRNERAEFIALAHNRDDQAETLLLQLLRGAGAKGLSAMPVFRIEDRGKYGGAQSAPETCSQSSILDPRSCTLRSQSCFSPSFARRAAQWNSRLRPPARIAMDRG